MRTYGPPQKTISSRHEVLGAWTDLQLSRLYHEVQEEYQNIWRELSKQDGSAQPCAPRSIIFILKYTLASALALCLFAISSTFLLLLRSFNMPVPNPASPSLTFLCRSRERNGDNNALLQEEAALNFQVTVNIGLVNLQITVGIGAMNIQITVGLGAGSKVGFHSDS